MTVDQFVAGIMRYTSALLAGACRKPSALRMHAEVTPQGVFIRARVDPIDFSELEYSPVLESVKALVQRAGAIRTNDSAGGAAFTVYFQLYDPRFERQYDTVEASDFWG